MKNQTVEKLWNIMICLGLAGLVVLFSMLYGMFLITAQEGSGHGYSGIEIGALCFFCLFTSFFMLRLSKGLKLFSFDLSFLTKKNLKIILIGTVLTLGILIAETILINQNILIEQAGNPRTMAVLSKASSLVIGLFTFILAPIMEEVLFRGGIIGLVFADKQLLGVFVSSLVYCLAFRPEGIIYWLLSLMMNIILGLAYVQTKRLEVPIIIKMLTLLLMLLF